MYDTYQLFHQHICQVCGSFQCPYCPYYNSANSQRASIWLTAFLPILLFMFLPHFLQDRGKQEKRDQKCSELHKNTVAFLWRCCSK